MSKLSHWPRLLFRTRRMRVLLISIGCLLLLLMGSLITLNSLVNAKLSQRRAALITQLSHLLDQPASIAHAYFSWWGLHPIVHLQNIDLQGAERTSALAVQHLAFGIDVWRTLLARQWQLSVIQLTHASITLQELDNGLIKIVGLDNLPPFSLNLQHQFPHTAIVDYLLSISRIGVSDVRLIWQDKEGRTELIHIERLRLSNIGERHLLTGNFYFERKPAQKIEFSIDAYQGADHHLHVHTAHVNALPISLFSGLVLEALHQEAQYHPLIQQLDPQGELQDIWIHVADPAVEPRGESRTVKPRELDWSLSGRFQDLGMQPIAKIPGVSHLSGQFLVTPNQAQVQIDSHGLKLTPVAFYHHPILISDLAMNLEWRRTNGVDEISAEPITLQLADTTAQAHARITLAPGHTPEIDLTAFSSRMSVGGLLAYLPQRIMSHKLYDWLTHAFIQGQAENIRVRWQGALNQFPYTGQDGIFQVAAFVNHADVAYLKDWPRVRDLSGDILFQGRDMLFTSNSGTIFHSQMQNTSAVIEDMGRDRRPMLHFTSQINGDLGNGLDFLREFPEKDRPNGLIHKISIQGPMQLHLQLNMPLKHTKGHVQVSGQVMSRDGELKIAHVPLNLEHVRGEIDFQGHALSADDLQAEFMRAPMQLQIRTPQAINGAMLVTANGKLDMQEVKRQFPKLALQHITGVTDFHTQLQIPNQQKQPLRMNIRSDLSGISVADSKLLGRSEDDPGKLAVHMDFIDQRLSKLNLYYRPDLGNPERLRTKLQMVRGVSGWQLGMLATGHTVTLRGDGVWRETSDKTEIQGNMVVGDVQQFLKIWSNQPFMGGKSLTSDFKLHWPGAPWMISADKLSGQAKLKMKRGALLNLKASTTNYLTFGKALTLLSIDSIPRRLTMNFNDLAGQGFNFDALHGDVLIRDGVLSTHNLALQGIVADLTLQGNTNLGDKSLAFWVTVTPHMTASAPAIAAIAGGPLIGAAALVADKLLSPALDKMSSRQYFLGGDWDAPEMEKPGSSQ